MLEEDSETFSDYNEGGCVPSERCMCPLIDNHQSIVSATLAKVDLVILFLSCIISVSCNQVLRTHDQ